MFNFFYLATLKYKNPGEVEFLLFLFVVVQLLSIGWKMVMHGDNTWLRLFPGFFTRHDGVNSFFVSQELRSKDSFLPTSFILKFITYSVGPLNWLGY